jgi:hypothetical protein
VCKDKSLRNVKGCKMKSDDIRENLQLFSVTYNINVYQKIDRPTERMAIQVYQNLFLSIGPEEK